MYTKKVHLELLRVYISKIDVHKSVPESMSGVQKVNFPDWKFEAKLLLNRFIYRIL